MSWLKVFWGDEPEASLVFSLIENNQIVISTVVVAEIYSKASALEEEKLETLLDKFGAYPLYLPVARQAGFYRKKFLAKGRKLKLPDVFLAATAKVYNLVFDCP